ncbi:hypothetical protein R4I43_12670 [Saccharopolyspora sp. S2-29]|uniref:Uncharacterized protein n=1 Tax=Saccharopolyspora mangrovi TaxID=3082379 RepID=A0ABU6A9N2_9PSEU|nr:hypothetical protein [Saccharopolyspora sp. S2-29]MEB3368260.1 hypothetical protein [Saccharopolyspora sp. S2-29]
MRGQGIPGGLGDPDVELGVEGVEVAGGQVRGVHLVEDGAQRKVIGASGVGGGLGDRPFLQRQPGPQHLGAVEVTERQLHLQQHRETRARVAEEHGSAIRPAAGPNIDDAQGFEHAQRFPQRRPAHSEELSELALAGQPVARCQTPVEDALLDLRHDLLVRPHLARRFP